MLNNPTHPTYPNTHPTLEIPLILYPQAHAQLFSKRLHEDPVHHTTHIQRHLQIQPPIHGLRNQGHETISHINVIKSVDATIHHVEPI